MRFGSLTFVFLSGALLSCGGGGGGGGTPTSPPPPTTNPGFASFTVAGPGTSNQPVGYSNDSGNLIFCRPNGVRWWVRLAAQRAADGEGGPHIDIDLCNYTGSGSYSPMDFRASCPGVMAWDIFWHDGSGNAFVSQATSSPCQLGLTLNGRTLDGTFSCRGLLENGGTRTLDVLSGMFRCTIEG